MKALEVYDLALHSPNGLFTTRELAQQTQSAISGISKILGRLKNLGKIMPLERGKWVVPSKAGRLTLPEFLAGVPTYITAHSALFSHGMIEQIPQGIYAATTGRSATHQTDFGPIYLHHITQPLFTGWETDDDCLGAKMATPEKALVDYFYFQLTGNLSFGKLPELEIPRGFSWKKVRQFADQIANKTWRSHVHNQLTSLQDQSPKTP